MPSELARPAPPARGEQFVEGRRTLNDLGAELDVGSSNAKTESIARVLLQPFRRNPPGRESIHPHRYRWTAVESNRRRIPLFVSER